MRPSGRNARPHGCSSPRADLDDARGQLHRRAAWASAAPPGRERPSGPQDRDQHEQMDHDGAHGSRIREARRSPGLVVEGKVMTAARPSRQHRVPDGQAPGRVRGAGRRGGGARLRRDLRLQRPPLSAGVAAADGGRAPHAAGADRPGRRQSLHVPPDRDGRPHRADRRGLARPRVPRAGPRRLARFPRARAGARAHRAPRGLRVRAPSAAPLARAVRRQGVQPGRRRLAPVGRVSSRARPSCWARGAPGRSTRAFGR